MKSICKWLACCCFFCRQFNQERTCKWVPNKKINWRMHNKKKQREKKRRKKIECITYVNVHSKNQFVTFRLTSSLFCWTKCVKRVSFHSALPVAYVNKKSSTSTSIIDSTRWSIVIKTRRIESIWSMQSWFIDTKPSWPCRNWSEITTNKEPKKTTTKQNRQIMRRYASENCFSLLTSQCVNEQITNQRMKRKTEESQQRSAKCGCSTFPFDRFHYKKYFFFVHLNLLWNINEINLSILSIV